MKIRAILDERTCEYCGERDELEITDSSEMPPFDGCTAGDYIDEDGNLVSPEDHCRCVILHEPPKPIPSPVRIVRDDRDMVFAAIAVFALAVAVLVGISI